MSDSLNEGIQRKKRSHADIVAAKIYHRDYLKTRDKSYRKYDPDKYAHMRVVDNSELLDQEELVSEGMGGFVRGVIQSGREGSVEQDITKLLNRINHLVMDLVHDGDHAADDSDGDDSTDDHHDHHDHDTTDHGNDADSSQNTDPVHVLTKANVLRAMGIRRDSPNADQIYRDRMKQFNANPSSDANQRLLDAVINALSNSNADHDDDGDGDDESHVPRPSTRGDKSIKLKDVNTVEKLLQRYTDEELIKGSSFVDPDTDEIVNGTVNSAIHMFKAAMQDNEVKEFLEHLENVINGGREPTHSTDDTFYKSDWILFPDVNAKQWRPVKKGQENVITKIFANNPVVANAFTAVLIEDGNQPSYYVLRLKELKEDDFKGIKSFNRFPRGWLKTAKHRMGAPTTGRGFSSEDQAKSVMDHFGADEFSEIVEDGGRFFIEVNVFNNKQQDDSQEDVDDSQEDVDDSQEDVDDSQEDADDSQEDVDDEEHDEEDSKRWYMSDWIVIPPRDARQPRPSSVARVQRFFDDHPKLKNLYTVQHVVIGDNKYGVLRSKKYKTHDVTNNRPMSMIVDPNTGKPFPNKESAERMITYLEMDGLLALALTPEKDLCLQATTKVQTESDLSMVRQIGFGQYYAHEMLAEGERWDNTKAYVGGFGKSLVTQIGDKYRDIAQNSMIGKAISAARSAVNKSRAKRESQRAQRNMLQIEKVIKTIARMRGRLNDEERFDRILERCIKRAFPVPAGYRLFKQLYAHHSATH